jgi:phage baseplate assembly protein W
VAKNRDTAFGKNRTFNIVNPIAQSTRDGVFKMSTNSIEKYKSDLYTLIFTGIGERVMEPNFGTNIKYLLFEPLTEDIYTAIRDDIVNRASMWIPEINIISVTFGNELEDRENNKVSIRIDFALTLDPTIQDLIEIQLGA